MAEEEPKLQPAPEAEETPTPVTTPLEGVVVAEEGKEEEETTVEGAGAKIRENGGSGGVGGANEEHGLKGNNKGDSKEDLGPAEQEPLLIESQTKEKPIQAAEAGVDEIQKDNGTIPKADNGDSVAIITNDEEYETDEKTNFWRSPQFKKIIVLAAALLILLIIIIVIAATIIGSGKKEPQTWRGTYRTPPMVKTFCGPVQGVEEDNVLVFKGIPYTKPPTGWRRWKPPAPLNNAKDCKEAWPANKTTLRATRFGKKCYQYDFFKKRYEGSEDCLFVNVWTPSINTSEPLPVMVWLHGGYLHFLSGNEPQESPTPEVVKAANMVFVSFNYRLNAFGFMALEILSKNSTTGTSGNYGFMDQIQALKWIQQNIRAFGGDPNKVTLFGQSSGATSVFTLTSLPQAKGLFHHAWLSSGSVRYAGGKSLKQVEADNLKFLRNTQCDLEEDVLACLYDARDIHVAMSVPWKEYPAWGSGDLMDVPINGENIGVVATIDGHFVKASPYDVWRMGKANNVSIVIGSTAQEIDFAPPMDLRMLNWTYYDEYVSERLETFSVGIATEALGLYPHKNTPEYQFTSLVSDCRVNCPVEYQAKKASQANFPAVYRYVVTSVPSEPVDLHGFGIPARYSFHGWDSSSFFGTFEQFISKPSSNDLAFQKVMRDALFKFARYGRIDTWSEFKVGTMLLNTSAVLATRYAPEKCDFWENNGFIPDYSWMD